MSRELYKRLHQQVVEKGKEIGLRPRIANGFVGTFCEAIKGEFGPVEWGLQDGDFKLHETHWSNEEGLRFAVRVNFANNDGLVLLSVVVPFIARRAGDGILLICLTTHKEVMLPSAGWAAHQFKPDAVVLFTRPVIDAVGDYISS